MLCRICGMRKPSFKSAIGSVFLGSSRSGGPCAAVTPVQLQRPEGRRDYLLALPGKPATGRRPLVVVLHGAGASAKQVLGMAFPPSPLSVWREIAEREEVIVAAADAGKGGWSDCFASDARVEKKDDVGFIGAIIDDAIARHGADPDRVHLIGVSRGGLMAYRVAVEIPHKLAAFSALLACMPPQGRARAPKLALPAMIVGCTADPFIRYEGGKYFHTLGFLEPMMSIEDSARVWRELAGLVDAPVVEEMTPADGGRKTRATRFLWGEANGPQVALYRIDGGGHAEPSRLKRYPALINRLVGPQNGDFEVAEAAWDFFKDKRRDERAASRAAS
jgi:polyhydroxybutyrate depolymerase